MARLKRPHRSWRPTRTIHLIDAENIAGTGRPTRLDLDAGRAVLEAATRPRPGDHTVVAASVGNALLVGLTWPHAQLLVGHGPDGADVALLDWAASADLLDRFDGVVIASGDFAVVGITTSLRAAGLPVVVASWRESCSKVLAGVATCVRWLDPLPTPAPSPSTSGVNRAA
jgi:hypothetical protein